MRVFCFEKCHEFEIHGKQQNECATAVTLCICFVTCLFFVSLLCLFGLCNAEWLDGWWIRSDLEGRGHGIIKVLFRNLTDELKKNMERFSHDIRCEGRGSIRALLECRYCYVSVLTVEQTLGPPVSRIGHWSLVCFFHHLYRTFLC